MAFKPDQKRGSTINYDGGSGVSIRQYIELEEKLEQTIAELEELKKNKNVDAEKLQSLEEEKATLLSRQEELLNQIAKEREEKNAVIENLKKDIDVLTADRDDISGQNARFKREYEEAIKNLNNSAAEIESQQKTLDLLKREKETLQASIDIMTASGNDDTAEIERLNKLLTIAQNREQTLEKEKQSLIEKTDKLRKTAQSAGIYKRSWEVQKEKATKALEELKQANLKLKENEQARLIADENAKKLLGQISDFNNLLAKKDKEIAEYIEKAKDFEKIISNLEKINAGSQAIIQSQKEKIKSLSGQKAKTEYKESLRLNRTRQTITGLKTQNEDLQASLATAQIAEEVANKGKAQAEQKAKEYNYLYNEQTLKHVKAQEKVKEFAQDNKKKTKERDEAISQKEDMEAELIVAQAEKENAVTEKQIAENSKLKLKKALKIIVPAAAIVAIALGGYGIVKTMGEKDAEKDLAKTKTTLTQTEKDNSIAEMQSIINEGVGHANNTTNYFNTANAYDAVFGEATGAGVVEISTAEESAYDRHFSAVKTAKTDTDLIAVVENNIVVDGMLYNAFNDYKDAVQNSDQEKMDVLEADIQEYVANLETYSSNSVYNYEQMLGYSNGMSAEEIRTLIENSKNLETVEITELNTDTKTYKDFKELFTSGKSGISNINIVYQRYEGLVTITYDQTNSKGKVTKGIIENFEIKTGIADNNAILKMIVEAIVAEAEAEI